MSKELPLDAKLPSDVFQKSSIGIAPYINYPVFGWAWLWRRTILFLPFMAVMTVIGAMNVRLPTGDWGLAAAMAAHSLPYWFVSTSAGPIFATIVRRFASNASIERVGIVLSILLGIVIGYLLNDWIAHFYKENVLPTLLAKGFVTKEAIAIAKIWSVGMVNEAISILVLALLGGGFAVRTYFSQQKRWQEYLRDREMNSVKGQRDDANRRLTVLQAQVEPHFLYNTLASVRSLVRNDPTRAEATIDALVDHLRATVPKMRDTGESISTLGEQAAICRSYLEVMRIRMGDRFSYRFDIPKELEGERFPALTLISLVENSIKHGIERKPGPCSLVLKAQLLRHEPDAVLEVSVLDDGAGLCEGPSSGMGLANIHAQLAMHYGERASLQLAPRDTGGAVATIRIPLEPSQS